MPRGLCLVLLAALALASGPAAGQAPKRGGILNAMPAEDPPGFSIHESSTISGVWPLSPCYSNLVLFDPLKPHESVTRNFAIYVDLASFVVDQLKQIGVEATLRQVDTAAWFPTLARREFQIGANLTAGVVDDRDAYFFENYKCGSPRNYTDYCYEQVDRLIDAQSQELDRARRQRLVWEIQRKLEADVARPMLGWRKEYFTQWPHVKNLVPHNALYNYGRMQDVWLDK